MKDLTHGSLFSGIGGFDLAAEWAGIENIFQVEKDSFCNKILEKNFPDVERHLDIKEFNGKKYKKTIDIVSGGFPCQPFSHAGKKRGNSDDRYLWDEMFRVVCEIKPEWVLAENVYGLISNNNGMVLEKVLTDLESEGFEVQTFIIPACSKNAPHRRDRAWIIANSEGNRNRLKQKRKGLQRNERNSPRRKRVGNKSKNGIKTMAELSWERDWLDLASELCGTDDGVPNRLDANKAIKALGNSIVPQLAYEFYLSIIDANKKKVASVPL